MARLSTFALTIVSMLLCGVTLPGSDAAQQRSLKDQLVGAWTLVSSTSKQPDYSSPTLRADRPKFASNNRLKGTADENKAAVIGGIASFGTYTVDEAKKTYTLKTQGSTYPNLEGTESVRPFSIEADTLNVTNPAPTSGGPASQLVYKRAK
jgi:lipocalin-like protein